MAQKTEPALVGTRIAEYRRRQRITADALAARIPAESITRQMIVNVETGRKRDLTATELVLIAAGLDVPPLALLVDLDEPFGPLPFDGLPEPYASMSIVEYLFDSDALEFDFSGVSHGFLIWDIVDSMRQIRELESATRELDAILTIRLRGYGPRPDRSTVVNALSGGEVMLITKRDLREESILARADELADMQRELSARYTRSNVENDLPEWFVRRVTQALERAQDTADKARPKDDKSAPAADSD